MGRLLQMSGVCLGVLLAVVNAQAARADETADQKLFERVMGRLLSSDVIAKEYPNQYLWPPKNMVMPKSEDIVNAFASASKTLGAEYDNKAKKIRPVVTVTQGMMHKVIQGDENSLAIIMGHELAHLVKNHVSGRKADSALLFLAFGRQQEIEADVSGLRFAIAAGYPYKTGVSQAFNKMRKMQGMTSFEGLGSTHPTWEERLAILDREQPKLWTAMSAFRNGFLFLDIEQFLAAQQCFKAVIAEFPDCHEAWANLGYAQLMRYCDGLDTDDLRQYGIAPIAAGGFYMRPASLESKVRGIDEKLWKDAVKSLTKAVTLKPELALPRASLGVAYLVHPEGKQAKKARQYFQEALERALKDTEVRDPIVEASLLINAAAADLAAGDVSASQEKLKKAGSRNEFIRLGLGNLGEAMLYNKALSDAKSSDKEEKRAACRDFEKYLMHASPDSAWWPLALEQYVKLAKATGYEALPRAALTEQKRPARMRLVVSVKVGAGAISLAQSTKEAMAILGNSTVEQPLFPNAKISRWHSAEHGIDLLGKEKILAIFLTSAKAPSIALQARGSATKAKELRVGMTEKEAQDVLQNQRAEKGKQALADASINFTFYPELGLAVRFADHRLEEIAIARVPRLSFAD